MKNFIYYFFLFLVFCFNKKIHSQCNRPSSVGNSISSITTSWGSRTGNTNKRIDFSATAGRTYTFSLCSDDGATCDFDSQMAIRLNSSPYTVQANITVVLTLKLFGIVLILLTMKFTLMNMIA